MDKLREKTFDIISTMMMLKTKREVIDLVEISCQVADQIMQVFQSHIDDNYVKKEAVQEDAKKAAEECYKTSHIDWHFHHRVKDKFVAAIMKHMGVGE